jgi:hypothetical protein
MARGSWAPWLALMVVAPAASAQEPTEMTRLGNELRSSTLTGQLKDIGLGRDIKIIAAAPAGEIVETPVPHPTRAAQRIEGRLDPGRLRTEVRQRFADLEGCRTTVADAFDVELADLDAGTIGLRWTILPSGATRGALVVEEADTDLDLMKCARERIKGWRFTGAPEGPVEVAYSYTFAPLPAAAPALSPAAAPALSDEASPAAPSLPELPPSAPSLPVKPSP